MLRSRSFKELGLLFGTQQRPVRWEQHANIELVYRYSEKTQTVKGYQSYHLHVFLSNKTQLIFDAVQLENQLFVLPTQSSVFIKKRKKLTLCLPKTLQLIKAN